MIYSIFMKKTQGDNAPYDISAVLNNYMSHLDADDIVLTVPGYMSTKKTTIANFINNLRFPHNTYFTVGMNGSQRNATLTTTIQQEHNSNFNLSITGLQNNNTDHSKMMFFLENNQLTTSINVQDLERLNVKAILIGSSNQSFTTYFGTPAYKGEADILLIDGDYLDNNTTAVYGGKDNFVIGLCRSGEREHVDRMPIGFDGSIAVFKELYAPRNLLNMIFVKTLKAL